MSENKAESRDENLSDFLAAVESAYDDINRELFESALSKKPVITMERRGAFSRVENTLHRIGSARTDTTGKKSSSTRKYVCPLCGMSVRATKEVRVMCMDCEEQMLTDADC